MEITGKIEKWRKALEKLAFYLEQEHKYSGLDYEEAVDKAIEIMGRGKE